jgi:sarcosine oxidase
MGRAFEGGGHLPGLRDNGAPAVFQPDAGTVLADVALRCQWRSFRESGGEMLKARVDGVDADPGSSGVRLDFTYESGPVASDSALFDGVILAPGPWAPKLLSGLGIDIVLSPSLQQVTYLSAPPGWERLPCILEVGDGTRPGMYGMPTPGRGYKLGLDRALRPFSDDDLDRNPDPAQTREIVERAKESFGWNSSRTESQVCCWTTSPDGRFVIDRAAGGRIVIACGDSGEGLKFSALMGELLTDLAEGADPPEYAAGFGLARLAGTAGTGSPPRLGY